MMSYTYNLSMVMLDTSSNLSTYRTDPCGVFGMRINGKIYLCVLAC
jgi:hypothetical protein